MKWEKTAIIIGIITVLVVGGVGAWLLLRPSDDDDEQEGDGGQTGAVQQPVKGRVDGKTIYSPDEIKTSYLTDGGKTSGNEPKPVPVLATSAEGQALVTQRAKNIQSVPNDMALIRARYDIGRALTDTRNFAPPAIDAIRNMMGQLDGVDASNHQTYPIYGSYERGGGELNAQLNRIANKHWQDFNLTKYRRFSDEPWLGSLSLNLMFGNRNAHMHSADKIWWYKTYDRPGLDFYKALNGHDVSDHQLIDTYLRDGNAAYAAGEMHKLVRMWLTEVQRLDEVVLQEAAKALEREGYITLTTGSSTDGKGGKMGV